MTGSAGEELLDFECWASPPPVFVFGGLGSSAGQTGTGTTTARHGSHKKGHKPGVRRGTATTQFVKPSHQHLVPLLVLRHVQDIPTLAAFSAVSQQFHDILSSKSGSVLWKQQLPALLAGLKAPKAPKAAGAPSNQASTWQPLRLWSPATRLQCLKWLCSLTTAEAINSPEVAQSLLQLFWTAWDIAPKVLVSTLSHAGLRLTPKLLLHGCQQQRLQRTPYPTMEHVLRLPGTRGPQGWLWRLFAGASIGQFRDPRGSNIWSDYEKAPAAHTLDTTSPAYKVLEVLGVASWPGTQKYLPGISIAADMLPLLLPMALCFQNHAQGDAMAGLLCSLLLEPPSAAQHSTPHSASSSSRASTISHGGRSSGGASTILESSSGGRGSSLNSCSSGSSSSSCGHLAAADSQSNMLASLIQQCIADGRDMFLDALGQSQAAALRGPATLMDLLQWALRSPAMRKPSPTPGRPHPMLELLVALPSASALGTADVAALLHEAVNSGTVSAEVLLQLPGASGLQAGQVLELLSAAVQANMGDDHAGHPRLVLARELARFASALAPDPAALVGLLKAAMGNPEPYSVLPAGSMAAAAAGCDAKRPAPSRPAAHAFSECVRGLSDIELLAWLHKDDVLELLGHCAAEKRVWAWNSLMALPPAKDLVDSDMHQLVAHYKAVVAAATAKPPTCPQGFKLTHATLPTCPRLLLAHMQPDDWVEVFADTMKSPLGGPPLLLKRFLARDPVKAEDVIIAAAEQQQTEVVRMVAAALPRLYKYSKPSAAAAAAAMWQQRAATAAGAIAATAAAAAAATAPREGVQQLPAPAKEPQPVCHKCEGDSAALMMGMGAAATATAAATAARGGMLQPMASTQEPKSAFDVADGGSMVMATVAAAAAGADSTAAGFVQQPVALEQEDPTPVFDNCEGDGGSTLMVAVAAAAAGAESSAASGGNLPGLKAGARSWLGWLRRLALLFCPWAQAG